METNLKHLTRCTLIALGCAGAFAAEPNLDELQRRLDAAKKAAQAAPRPDAPTAPAASGAASTRSATLMLRADAPCRLTIDSRPAADLGAGEMRMLNVAAGVALIECESTAEATVKYGAVYKLESGTKKVLFIELRDRITNLRQERESAAGTPAGDKKRQP